MTTIMKFKISDKVRLATKRYGDCEEDPLWGGSYGKISGTVYKIEEVNTHIARVEWTNGNRNSYEEKDLKYAYAEWDEDNNE